MTHPYHQATATNGQPQVQREQPVTLEQVGRKVAEAFSKSSTWMVEVDVQRLENGKWPTCDSVERVIREHRKAMKPEPEWKSARAQLKGWMGASVSVCYVVEKTG